MAENLEELPPKTVKAQLVRLDDNLKRIERSQFAGIQRAPGSLPVLEAFQLFLENERKIAQRRLLMVSAAAVIAIVISLVGSLLYIRHALGKANDQTNILAQTTQALEQNLGSLSERQSSTDQMLTETQQSLAEQKQAIEAHASTLARQFQNASANQQEQSTQVIQLREQMEALLADQDAIRRMLESPQNQTQRSTQPGNASFPDATANNTIGPSRRRVEKVAPQRPEPVQYAVITLTPEGRSGVRWMLPIGNAQE